MCTIETYRAQFFQNRKIQSTISSSKEKRESGLKGRNRLQDPFLNALRRERVPVSIYLVNGIKLQGQIESFDQFVILLKNTVSQMVYKHAISTVVPSRPVSHHSNNAGGGTSSNYHHGSSAQNTSAQQDSEETE